MDGSNNHPRPFGSAEWALNKVSLCAVNGCRQVPGQWAEKRDITRLRAAA